MSLRPKTAWRSAAVLGAAIALTLGACGTEEPGPSESSFEGTLKLGTILPQTGSLAFLGPPEFAGVDLAIKEIMVSGDMAAVRLVWTLTVKRQGQAVDTVTSEPGLDIFRRQPNGRWSISRFIAFDPGSPEG